MSQDVPDSSKFRTRKSLESTLKYWITPHWGILGIIPLLIRLGGVSVCKGEWEGGGEQGSEPFHSVGSGTPVFAIFLHSVSSKNGPDSRQDLEATYLEQITAKPVFISLCVCVLNYHTSIAL